MSDLQELFSRDPLSYSKQDLKEIIKIFREKRGQFNAGALGAGSTKPKSEKAKAVQSVADKLGELDL